MGTEKQEELLQIKNLAISFYNKSGEVQAVRGISYTLHKGEVLGIVGESGSGKSVSSHGILRLTPDTGKVKSGEILFHGKDILKMSRKELQELRGNKIAMIFQDPMTSLDPLFTVEYQLNESLKKHTSLDAQARKKRMMELLTLVGINQPERRVKQYPYEFSGGMRQRVMIAMALSCDPELLIADEPTTALDVTIQAQIVELLKELKEKLGMAIIFITHDLGVVSDICDNIMVIKNLFGFASCQNRSEIQHGKLLAYTCDKLHIMLYKQNCHIEFVSYKLNRFHKLRRFVRVHACGRLIEKQKLRMSSHCSGDFKLSLLSVREI